MNDEQKELASKAPQSLQDVKSNETEVHFELTEQNILFLRHIQSGMKVKDAYKSAGYESLLPNVPYQFYWRLKKKLQALVESDSLDDLRLRIELSKILQLPLRSKDNPEGVTVAEKLRTIEVTDKILNGKSKMDRPSSITAFVVNRYDKPASNDVTQGSIEAEQLPS